MINVSARTEVANGREPEALEPELGGIHLARLNEEHNREDATDDGKDKE